MADLSKAQRAVFDALQEHCFNGPTCWPSQETLAYRTGYRRETVNRVLRELRDLGWVTWTQAKSRIGKWRHNVYKLAFWVPPLRWKTLQNLAWIKALKARDHTKRTPKPFQGSNETDTPCSVILEDQRGWSREANSPEEWSNYGQAQKSSCKQL